MTRLYRNRDRGVLFGVCAGIADYSGFDITVTRVVVIIGAMFATPLLVVAYLLLAFLLPTKPSDMPDSSTDPVKRHVRADPHDMLASARYRFRELDSRLQRLEKYVTSNRFQLDREFRQLKD